MPQNTPQRPVEREAVIRDPRHPTRHVRENVSLTNGPARGNFVRYVKMHSFPALAPTKS
jgi:hypothetical protein